MIDLADLQAIFLDDIYKGTDKSLPYIDDAHHGRLSIYRNNAVLTLVDLLSNLFPVTRRLVGDNYFNQTARAYIKSNPQHSGNRHLYGQEFPAFIATAAGMETLPYVSEVASIEWAFFASSLAEDHAVFTLNDLQNTDVNHADFKMRLHPSVHLLTHNYNALAIWAAHQNDSDPDDLNLQQGINSIAVWRGAGQQVYMRPIDGASFALLNGCQNGQTLTQCLESASHYTDDVTTLQADFGQFVHTGFFTRSLI